MPSGSLSISPLLSSTTATTAADGALQQHRDSTPLYIRPKCASVGPPKWKGWAKAECYRLSASNAAVIFLSFSDGKRVGKAKQEAKMGQREGETDQASQSQKVQPRTRRCDYKGDKETEYGDQWREA